MVNLSYISPFCNLPTLECPPRVAGHKMSSKTRFGSAPHPSFPVINALRETAANSPGSCIPPTEGETWSGVLWSLGSNLSWDHDGLEHLNKRAHGDRLLCFCLQIKFKKFLWNHLSIVHTSGIFPKCFTSMAFSDYTPQFFSVFRKDFWSFSNEPLAKEKILSV